MNRNIWTMVSALLLVGSACRKENIHRPNSIDSSSNSIDQSKYQVYETQEPRTEERVYASTKDKAPMSGRVYLWDEDNLPRQNPPSNQVNNPYADPIAFRPFVEIFTTAQAHQPKGAIVLCAGGGFMFRANQEDTYPTMRRLVERGYQVFVVQYRVLPWTMAEGIQDVTRAIRFVRAHAGDYRITGDRIAAIGYSAGGMLLGEQARANGIPQGNTSPESSYRADELDQTNGKISALGLIYSYYLSLEPSSQTKEVAHLLPPTFFAYGSVDPFYKPIKDNIRALKESGNSVESKELEGYKHGFGAGQSDADWIEAFDAFLQRQFSQAT